MVPRVQVNFLTVLRNRRYRNLWIGQTISDIGDYFYLLAVPILINEITGSAWAIGLAVFFSVTLPGLLFSVPAGALIDRWDRRKVMIVADLARAGLVLGGLLVHDAATTQLLWVTGFFVGVAGCFFFPAYSALIPALVNEDELPAANGLSQVTTTIAWAAGPALAGFTIAGLGASAAFVVDSASFLISAFAIWTIGSVEDVKLKESGGRVWASLWFDVKAGLQFVAHNPLVRAVILGMATVQLGLGAANVLWVPFLADNYQAGPGAIGLVDSVQGVGMGLGALAVGWLAVRASQARIAALGFIFTGLSLSLVGVAPNMAFIFMMMLIHGAAFTPARAAVFTLLQQGSPGQTRGRVFGALGLFTRSAGSLSTVLAAGAAGLLGIRAVYIGCGGFIILAGVIFLRIREVQLPAGAPAE